MSPPLYTFPVSTLEDNILTKSKNNRTVSRKLPKDFDLLDCELLRIVQYSCTTLATKAEHARLHPKEKPLDTHCYPFTRLFRKCTEGGIGGRHRVFHVETTSWEGEWMWDEVEEARKKKDPDSLGDVGKLLGWNNDTSGQGFAKYSGFLWSSTHANDENDRKGRGS